MMKKFTRLKTFYFVIGSGLLFSTAAFAKQVPENNARTVAENFFRKHSQSGSAARLSYTSRDAQGNPVFYAFNMNNNSGFVIISAEDAARPVIGYSTERAFEKPDSRSPVAFWLSKRENEIISIREKNTPATAVVSSAWDQYLTVQTANKSTAANSIVVGPLLLTTWNQSPFYNDSCPGGSVTGCVATTMAQIMKYWGYPNKGTGSSSYCDCISSGYQNDFGVLAADYSAATYNWNSMPLAISSHNSEIAKLMYHCGVSVEMSYDPAGSSAAVIAMDSPVSAEVSYINYFKYDPNTILGVHRASYSDQAWLDLLKGDLDIGRPVQYAGFGPVGGHTWVCDGYDSDNLFHMNWGWGGSGDGYFDVDGLNPVSNDFNSWQQGLFGIVPMGTFGDDAGVVSITGLDAGCSSDEFSPKVRIRNYSSDPMLTCVINYKIDNGAPQTILWNGSLVTGQTEDVDLTALLSLGYGAHNLTCYVSDPNGGTDVNTANDQSSSVFALFGGGTLPVVEGFETPSQTANSWKVMPVQSGSEWQFTTQSFSGGAQSMMVNNLDNTPNNTSILQGLNNYDFGSILHPTFYFKVAYQQKAATNKDKLSLEISNDCGKTWWVKWSKQGAALASTNALSSTPFVPAASDYIQYSVPGMFTHNTAFRWVFVSDATAPGNNVYLDDINLGERVYVGIDENSASENSFDVYPNPGNGATTLKFALSKPASVEVNVTDISGRKVIDIAKTEYSAGDQLLSINKDSSLSQGVYLVTITANGMKSSRRLIIN